MKKMRILFVKFFKMSRKCFFLHVMSIWCDIISNRSNVMSMWGYPIQTMWRDVLVMWYIVNVMWCHVNTSCDMSLSRDHQLITSLVTLSDFYQNRKFPICSRRPWTAASGRRRSAEVKSAQHAACCLFSLQTFRRRMFQLFSITICIGYKTVHACLSKDGTKLNVFGLFF